MESRARPCERPGHVVTAPQRGIQAVIREVMQNRGSPATMQEICDTLGRKSAYLLEALQDKGLPRGDSVPPCTVTRRPLGRVALLFDAEDLPRELCIPWRAAAYVLVPVYGRIPAGPLNLAKQVFESAFLLSSQLVGEGNLFMLKVAGDSMINAGIADGSWVVVRQQEDAQNGEIVVAMVEGEATVKTLRLSGSKVELVPQNPVYEPISGEEVTILGKVVGVVCQS